MTVKERKQLTIEVVKTQDELLKTFEKALLNACEIVSAQYEGYGIKETKEDLYWYFLERANNGEKNTGSNKPVRETKKKRKKKTN